MVLLERAAESRPRLTPLLQTRPRDRIGSRPKLDRRHERMQLMSSAVIVMKWENYVGGADSKPLFAQEPLTFNSGQERLQQLKPGDRLWLVSRCPDDQQYYFAAILWIAGYRRNTQVSAERTLFGEYAVIADRAKSHDLGKSFRADG